MFLKVSRGIENVEDGLLCLVVEEISDRIENKLVRGSCVILVISDFGKK